MDGPGLTLARLVATLVASSFVPPIVHALPPAPIETVAYNDDLLHYAIDLSLDSALRMDFRPLATAFESDAPAIDAMGRTGHVELDLLESSNAGLKFWGDLRDGESRDVIGVDLSLRTDAVDGAPIEALAWIKGTEPGADPGDQAAFGGTVKQRDRRMPWTIGFAQYGESFIAAPRRGVREYTGTWRYRLPTASLPVRRLEFGVSGLLQTDIANEMRSMNAKVDLVELETTGGDVVTVRYLPYAESLTAPRSVAGGVQVAAGNYRYDRYGAGLKTRHGPFTIGVDYVGGEYYTGAREDWRVSLAWRLSQWMTMRFDFAESDFELPEGDARTRTAKTNIDVRLAPTVSWRSAFGYDRSSGTVGLNSRVRWAIQPGNEIAIGFGQSYGMLEDVGWEEPQLTTSLQWGLRF